MAPDPNSLVDYLRARGYASSFDARRRLWGLHDARETYTGSARQNRALLASLRRGEGAPDLRPTAALGLYDIGQAVDAVVVAGAPVMITNEFGRMTQEAQPGQTIRLGMLDYAGVFPITMETGLSSTQGALMVLPHASGRILVGFVATPVEFDTAPVPLDVRDGDEALLVRFYDALDQALLESALAATWEDTLKADALSGMGLDVFFGVLLLFIPGTMQMKLIEWGWTVSGWVFDALHTFVDKLAEQADGFSVAERARLKVILAAPVAVARLGTDLFRLRKDRDVCGSYDLLQGTGDNFLIKTFNFEPEDERLKMAGSMVRDAASKSIGFVCQVSKKP